MCQIELLAGEKQKGESDNAAIACNDWLRIGPGRSLSGLLKKYAESYQNKPPTQSLATLKGWSKNFKWSDRSVDFDAKWEQIKNRERAAEMEFGLALDYERVRKLKRLGDFLEAQIYELGEPDEETGECSYHNVWMPDVKQIGSGDDAEKVELERFNSSLFTQYRETLNDLAKETGGRVQKQEHRGAGKDGAIVIEIESIFDDND